MESCFSWAGTLYHYLSYLDTFMALGIVFFQRIRELTKASKPSQDNVCRSWHPHHSVSQDRVSGRWLFFLYYLGFTY